MLFKNLRSGNILSVADASTAELMRQSETYQEIKIDTPTATEEKAEEKKTRKPRTKK